MTIDFSRGRLIEGATYAAFLIICLGLVVGHDLRKETFGHDMTVYCSAQRAIDSGRDPYYVENLAAVGAEPADGVFLSYSYPPLVAKAFWPLCQLGKHSYVFLDLAILGLVFLIVQRGPDSRLLLLTVLCTSYLAVRWNLMTGNIGIYELGVLALVFVCLRMGHYSLPFLLVGLLGFVKVVPLALALLALAVDRSTALTVRIARASLAAVVFISLHVISFLIYPTFEKSFFKQLLGKIPDQHAAIKETFSGRSNPTLMFFLRDFFKSVSLSPGVSTILALAAVAIMVAIALGVAWLLVKRLPAARELELASLVFLLILVLLPRLKPYSFAYALIPTWILLKDRSLPERIGVTGFLLALPLASLVSNPSLPAPIAVVISNLQVVALLLVTAYFAATTLLAMNTEEETGLASGTRGSSPTARAAAAGAAEGVQQARP